MEKEIEIMALCWCVGDYGVPMIVKGNGYQCEKCKSVVSVRAFEDIETPIPLPMTATTKNTQQIKVSQD